MPQIGGALARPGRSLTRRGTPARVVPAIVVLEGRALVRPPVVEVARAVEVRIREACKWPESVRVGELGKTSG